MTCYTAKKKSVSAILSIIILFSLHPGAIAQKNRTANPDESISFYINEYNRDISDLQRVYIFPLSREYFTRFTRFTNEWLQKLNLIYSDKLSASEQVDFTLLKRDILEDQYELEKNKKDFEAIAYAIPFTDEIVSLQQKRRRGNTLDGRETAAALNKIIQSVSVSKNEVSKKPVDNKELQQQIIKAVQDLRKGLKNFYSFYNGYDPDFSWWMKSTYPQTDSALSAYEKWIASQPVTNPDKSLDNSGIIGHPIGREELIRQLNYQMIPYSPEELIEISKQQYEWCEKEMIKVSQQMGFGTDWKKALEKVKQNYLKPGQQPAMINKLQEEAIAYIDKEGLVTIPQLAREVWRMDMLSVQQMRFASYFLGGPQILIAFPHEDQDYDTKMMVMRSGNYGFAHAEVFHELIPGHNLQSFMFGRYKPYRNNFNSPFSMEGWPFYWEMILWNKGFDKTADEKVGALFWRMTRCVRIVFSLNYHLGNWTPQQCIDYMVDKAGLERFSAESEVRRSFTGGYGPLYQLAYMIGALQLYSLHHEIVESGKMTEREFNDAYLREGPIPIEMFRSIILNDKTGKEFSTKWKFMNGVKMK